MSSQIELNTDHDLPVEQIYKNLWGANVTQQNMTTMLNGLVLEVTAALRASCYMDQFTNAIKRNVAIVLDVVWFWLIFPGVLIVAIAAFLGVVMAESHRRGSAMWKNGILPLLFHSQGLTAAPTPQTEDGVVHGPAVYQEVPPEMAKELQQVGGMQKLARGMRVQLRRSTSGGWQ